MIKDNQKIFNRLQVLLDAFVIVVAYASAWFLKFRSKIAPFYTGADVGALSGQTYFNALYLIIPVYLFLYYLFYGNIRRWVHKKNYF